MEIEQILEEVVEGMRDETYRWANQYLNQKIELEAHQKAILNVLPKVREIERVLGVPFNKIEPANLIYTDGGKAFKDGFNDGLNGVLNHAKKHQENKEDNQQYTRGFNQAIEQKRGNHFFAYSPSEGMHFFSSLEEARQWADDELDDALAWSKEFGVNPDDVICLGGIHARFDLSDYIESK